MNLTREKANVSHYFLLFRRVNGLMAKRDGMTTRRTKEEIEISRGGGIFEAFVVRIVSND